LNEDLTLTTRARAPRSLHGSLLLGGSLYEGNVADSATFLPEVQRLRLVNTAARKLPISYTATAAREALKTQGINDLRGSLASRICDQG